MKHFDRRWCILLLGLFVAVGTGCADSEDLGGLVGPGGECESKQDCQNELECIEGVCVKDTDGDGIADSEDNCPEQSNPDQKNAEGDDRGDVCDDDDDTDGVSDDKDNCPETPNTDQKDRDEDGTGDVCDDGDGDGRTDDEDNCPEVKNPAQTDTDGDNTGDACDDDTDGDGVPDDGDDSGDPSDAPCEDGVTESCDDNCTKTPNADQSDKDSDGIGDACDPDTTRRTGGPTDDSCEFSPPVGEFEPNESWRLAISDSDPYPEHRQVMMTPVVANLTDDNGDGQIDDSDTPDIIFATFTTTNVEDGTDLLNEGVLRAASGDGSGLLWSVGFRELELEASAGIQPGGNIAVGDLDGDGTVEIVAGLWHSKTPTGGLAAISHNGQVEWLTSAKSADGIRIPHQYRFWWGGPSIADLDGNDTPEIVVGPLVFTNNGELAWDGRGAEMTGPAGEGINWKKGDPSNRLYTGMLSVVADLDLKREGNTDKYHQEVVTGRTAYKSDGTVLWEADSSLPDGFPAIGDFQGDGFSEVAVSADGSVRIHDGQTGDVVWGPIDIQGSQGGAGGRIGPPTIADFTGDGSLEIGVAGKDQYVTLDVDLESDASEFSDVVLWQVETQDASSNMTGSSVFDFEGDGRAEVIYNDEQYLRVFDGRGEEDGSTETLLEKANSSFTALEYPVIADVDNDGAAEIIVGSNNFECGDQLDCKSDFAGIRVLGDSEDNWVSTRPVWNQHSYHITNVGLSGQIPAQETPSWTAHNTYRLNKFTSRPPQAAPDLELREAEVVSSGDCRVEAQVWVANSGAAQVGGDLPVSFYAVAENNRTHLGTKRTRLQLRPGESERIDVELSLPSGGPWRVEAVADDPGDDSGSTENECVESNNSVEIANEVQCSE